MRVLLVPNSKIYRLQKGHHKLAVSINRLWVRVITIRLLLFIMS